MGSILLTAVFAIEWQAYVLPAIPIVVGALVAGISAAVKTSYERRDTRRRAQGQLELAVKRTEFVRSWLEVSRSIDDDPDDRARVNSRARQELDNAYSHAQSALDEGRSALEHSEEGEFGRQLLSLLLLEKRQRFASYLAVAVFYLLITSLWLGVAVTDEKTLENGEPNPDYLPWWQYGIIAIVGTIVLRVIFGFIVGWLERRGSTTPTPAQAPTALPPPGSSSVPPTEPPSPPAADGFRA